MRERGAINWVLVLLVAILLLVLFGLYLDADIDINEERGLNQVVSIL